LAGVPACEPVAVPLFEPAVVPPCEPEAVALVAAAGVPEGLDAVPCEWESSTAPYAPPTHASRSWLRARTRAERCAGAVWSAARH
jgi:hypothetical protein